MDEKIWNWGVFFIGFLAGVILILIILLISYIVNGFVFTNCVNGPTPCLATDYYNDYQEALDDGYKPEDIFFIGPRGRLFYRRVPRNQNCRPGVNQIIRIKYPPICQFSSGSRSPLITGNYQGDGEYKLTDGRIIKASENCIPDDPNFTTGNPVIPSQ